MRRVNLAAMTAAWQTLLEEKLQNFAMILAIIILVLIVAGTIFAWWSAFSVATLPPAPQPPAAPAPGASPDTAPLDYYRALVEQYKVASDIQVSRFTSVFQVMVVAAFLPTFTALVGYLFGKRQA